MPEEDPKTQDKRDIEKKSKQKKQFKPTKVIKPATNKNEKENSIEVRNRNTVLTYLEEDEANNAGEREKIIIENKATRNKKII